MEKICTSCKSVPVQPSSTKTVSPEQLLQSRDRKHPVSKSEKPVPVRKKIPEKENLPQESIKNTKPYPLKDKKNSPVPAILAVFLVILGALYFLEPDFIQNILFSAPERTIQPAIKTEALMTGGENTETATQPAGNLEDTFIAKPLPVSGTRAVHQELFSGMTIIAEENALDTDRTFTGHRLPDEELITAAKTYRDQGYVILDAFEMNCGLNEGERLPNSVEMEIDLKAFEIPEALWDDISLLKLNPSGKIVMIANHRDGPVLTALTDENSIFAITVGLTIGAVVAKTIETGAKRNWIQMWNRKYSHEEFLSHYVIYWPEDMPPAAPGEIKKVLQQITALENEYLREVDEEMIENAVYAGSSLQYHWSVKQALVRLKADPRFQKLSEQLIDPKKVVPLSVQLVIDALAEADHYLFSERLFKRPGHTTEIYVFDRWPYSADILGYSENPDWDDPYIHINASSSVSLPDNVDQIKAANFPRIYRRQIDDLQLTLIHELFHVVQSGYVWTDLDRYTWFWEATAVLLEKEAFQYGLTHKFHNHSPLIDPQRNHNIYYQNWPDINTRSNFYETFAHALGRRSLWTQAMDGDRQENNQAYTASTFLEFMRNEYYPAASSWQDDFLKNLIVRFSRTYSYSADIRQLLCDQLGISPETFDKKFIEYSRRNAFLISSRVLAVHNNKSSGDVIAAALIQPDIPVLSADNPRLKIDSAAAPLTIDPKIIGVDLGGAHSETTISVRRTASFLERGGIPETQPAWLIADVKNSGNSAVTQIAQMDDSAVRAVSGHASIYQVNGEISASGKKEISYLVTLMPKPDVPDLEIVDQKLKITMPRKSYLFGKNIAKGWLVWVHATGYAQPLLLECTEDALILPLNSNGYPSGIADDALINKVRTASSNYIGAYGSLRNAFQYDWQALEKLTKKPADGSDPIEYAIFVMEMTKDTIPVYSEKSDLVAINADQKQNGYLRIISYPGDPNNYNSYNNWYGSGEIQAIQLTMEKLDKIPLNSDGSFSFTAVHAMKLHDTTAFVCEISGSGAFDSQSKKGSITLKIDMNESERSENPKFKDATGCVATSQLEKAYSLSGAGNMDLRVRTEWPIYGREFPSRTFVSLAGTVKGSSIWECDMFSGSGSKTIDEPYDRSVQIMIDFFEE